MDNETKFRREDKLNLCTVYMVIGMLLMFMGFAVGMVITAIGGNNWELMKESPKIMVAFNIDQLVMWFGLFVTMGGAVGYNFVDNK